MSSRIPLQKATNFPVFKLGGVAIPRYYPATLWFFDVSGVGYPFGAFISNEGILTLYQKQTMGQFLKDSRRYVYIGQVPDQYPIMPTFGRKSKESG